MASDADRSAPETVTGHGGLHVTAALQAAGIDTLFALSGGHLFPLYDGCVQRGVRLVDTRHEQAAAFAAEGLAKLTRRPQACALTAGPGVTNGMSAIVSAQFNTAPLVVIGGRAPAGRWGSGSLQELDHVPFLAPVTRSAATATAPDALAAETRAAIDAAAAAPRGPAFLDVPLDVIFASGTAEVAPWTAPAPAAPDTGAVDAIAARLVRAERPVIVAGSGVWWNHAEDALVAAAEALEVPVVVNGQGRGCMPADHRLAAGRARSVAISEADLVVVIGTPLDFRLGFGAFGTADVVHVMDTAEAIAGHVALADSVSGDLRAILAGLAHFEGAHPLWATKVAATEERRRDEEDLVGRHPDGDGGVHPARVYGELVPHLARDAVVICDGGDFVSYAGRYVDTFEAGRWLDPGPFGCLGTGIGYAMAATVAAPHSQVVVLMGDGALGFSGLELDSLVRHRMNVTIVVGNNGIWGLEKHPMNALYGYDVIADLTPGTRYDEVMTALGGHGELCESAGEIGPALERAFAEAGPSLVNVLTDPSVAYPRSSNLA